MKALFLCGKARMGSPTCADLAAGWRISSDFAGLGANAHERVSAEQVDWAGLVSVMEARQGRILQSLLPGPLRGKRVVTPNIPDRFTCGDPELIALVTPKLRAALRPD